jgi:hypothetical protein
MGSRDLSVILTEAVGLKWIFKYTQSVKAIRRHLLTTLLLHSSNLLFIEPAQASLYVFTSHTFTNCSASGISGPSQATCRSAYSTTWDENNSYFTVTGGIQSWTVPVTGTYTITVVGGGGGGGATGGKPASMRGELSLTQGAVIKILIGQLGTSDYGGGGGGGSFVVTNSNSALIVGGGGGGKSHNGNVGGDASIVANPGNSNGDATAPNSYGGCGMNGGGGGGFSTDGSAGAKSFLNGGSGGSRQTGSCVSSGLGGFGGGGGGGNGGGGGGGYFGGAPGQNLSPYPGGFGGGSYNSGANQLNSLAANSTSHGSVTITAVAPDTTPPTFTSSSTFSAAENIATSATAATIQVSESATVTISSGADAARFNITRSETNTAIIKFNVSPDFEAPADVGSNNVYEITLTATDAAANAGTQSITITVTNLVDTSAFNALSLPGSATTASYRTVVVITANVTVASKVTFIVNGKVLPGCKNKSTSGSSPNIVATCTWKPSNRGNVLLTASATPTGAGISSSNATPVSIMVDRRTGPRGA